MSDTTVTVPRWALQFVMDYANFMDRGPFPEGWSSEKMKQATEALEKALEKGDNLKCLP